MLALVAQWTKMPEYDDAEPSSILNEVFFSFLFFLFYLMTWMRVFSQKEVPAKKKGRSPLLDHAKSMYYRASM